MGSLVPGWERSAPGVAPEGFQDYNDEEEAQGYFAQLSKLKKLQREEEAGGAAQPLPISRRNSMPLGRRSNPLASPAGARSFNARGGAPESPLASFGSFKGGPPPALARMTSMPVTAGERVDILGPGTPRQQRQSGSPKQTPHASFTGDASSSPRSPLDVYRMSAASSAPGGAGSYAWWRHLDSAALNIKPDEKGNGNDRGYVPQFEVAGQGMRYRQHTDEEGAHPVVEAL